MKTRNSVKPNAGEHGSQNAPISAKKKSPARNGATKKNKATKSRTSSQLSVANKTHASGKNVRSQERTRHRDFVVSNPSPQKGTGQPTRGRLKDVTIQSTKNIVHKKERTWNRSTLSKNSKSWKIEIQFRKPDNAQSSSGKAVEVSKSVRNEEDANSGRETSGRRKGRPRLGKRKSSVEMKDNGEPSHQPANEDVPGERGAPPSTKVSEKRRRLTLDVRDADDDFTYNMDMDAYADVIQKHGLKNLACPSCEHEVPYTGKVSEVESMHEHLCEHHMSGSFGEPTTCLVCGERFVPKHHHGHGVGDAERDARKRARYHMHSHINDKQFPCGFCAAHFSTRGSLLFHLRAHQNSARGPLQCTECGRRFQHHHQLDNHAKTHKSVDVNKAYKCDHCQRTFDALSNFANHLRTHKDQLQCPMCHQNFEKQKNFDEHLKSHKETSVSRVVC